jgi:hypothetical protein
VNGRERILPFFENEFGPVVVCHDVAKIRRPRQLC